MKKIRQTFYYNGTFTAPTGVKYVTVYGVKYPPAPISGLAGFFIDSFGALHSYGSNTVGQLGDGTSVSKSSPVAVVGGLSFASLHYTLSTTYGITTSGDLYSWGNNSSGQLGDGTTTNRSSPVAVVGGLKFQKVICGSSALCAWGLTPAGTLYAWGDNTNGELGDNTVVAKSSPIAVSGGLTFTDITFVSSTGIIGITNTGAAYAWGVNTNGNIGDGTTTNRSSPTAVLGGLVFTKIVCTGSISAASVMGLTSSGAAYGWGYNADGRLGVGDTTPRSSPVAVLGGLSFTDIYAGGFNASTGGNFYLQTTDGTIYSIGNNLSGELGVGDNNARSSPVAVVGGLTFKQLYTGTSGGRIGLTTTGAAYGWGDNTAGNLGVGDNNARSSPVAVVGGLSFTRLTTMFVGAFQNSGAYTANGQLYTWGSNTSGQLGDGTTNNRSSPVAVLGVFLPNVGETIVSKLITVTPGNTYAVNIQQYNGQFGLETLGPGPYDYIVVEYSN